jgi:hypothetical protein
LPVDPKIRSINVDTMQVVIGLETLLWMRGLTERLLPGHARYRHPER